ncbi:MAG: hypothetical protein ABI643_03685 [Candidatus Doudnabacteria bacterium]
MPGLLDVPAGTGRFGVDATIRPLFENVGIPGYFNIAAEIPPELMDAPVPESDYMLTFYDKPHTKAYRAFRHPTVEETLWAVGWMSCELAGKICERPMRFLHRPFRVRYGRRRDPEAWRQIVVKRSGAGYAVETVAASTPVSGFQLAYTFDPSL